MNAHLTNRLEQAAAALEVLNMFTETNKPIIVCMEGIKKALLFPYHKNNDLIQYLAATITSEIRRVSFLIGRGDQGNESDKNNG